MNELDKKIAAALQQAATPIDADDDPTLLDDLTSIFGGRMRWIMILAWIKLALLVVVLLVCIYQFFLQESVMAMLAYATLATIAIVGIAGIYILSWIQISQNSTLREIKRLELQVALLAQQLAADRKQQ